MRLEDLDYQIAPERIAQRPAERRDRSRLLVVERACGKLHDARFEEIGRWLRPGDALAVNETRVRPSCLELRRESGGRVQLTIVRPGGHEGWGVLARPARKATAGARLATRDGSLVVEVVEAGAQGERRIRVVRGDLEATLRTQGEILLPPYIRRAPEPADRERYQTVVARVEGAVAAPTAGLHFSAELLATLEAHGVTRVPVLLHVGPGTFRPVRVQDPRGHRMDEEYFDVPAASARALTATRARGGRIVAVGTTTVRALEAACDAGRGTLAAARGWTRKYILPPYRFQAVDALLTNFHLPRSTLLLLVAAFVGEDLLRKAYAHAIAGDYRFYSYGDAMLIV